jgi:hypothetical protein
MRGYGDYTASFYTHFMVRSASRIWPVSYSLVK